MKYRLHPAPSMQEPVVDLARHLLGDAVATLEAVSASPDPELAIHDARKRTKEVRALARLVRPALGPGFAAFDHTVRTGARAIGATREAHAAVAVIADLARDHELGDSAHRTRRRHERDAARVDKALRSGGGGTAEAVDALRHAAELVGHWQIPDGFDTFAAGLRRIHRLGRTRARTVAVDGDAEAWHDWRKSVKHLWYGTRLLQPASPSVLDPHIQLVGDLGESLGTEHDLGMLIARLDADKDKGVRGTKRVRRRAEERRRAIRIASARTGAAIYAERPTAFVERVEAYWQLTLDQGPEPVR